MLLPPPPLLMWPEGWKTLVYSALSDFSDDYYFLSLPPPTTQMAHGREKNPNCRVISTKWDFSGVRASVLLWDCPWPLLSVPLLSYNRESPLPEMTRPPRGFLSRGGWRQTVEALYCTTWLISVHSKQDMTCCRILYCFLMKRNNKTLWTTNPLASLVFVFKFLCPLGWKNL